MENTVAIFAVDGDSQAIKGRQADKDDSGITTASSEVSSNNSAMESTNNTTESGIMNDETGKVEGKELAIICVPIIEFQALNQKESTFANVANKDLKIDVSSIKGSALNETVNSDSKFMSISNRRL